MDNSLNVRPLTVNKTGMKRGTLEGEVAVITGGGSNIGLGTARSLAWLGAKIVIAQRTEQTGINAAELINRETRPGTAVFIKTDVTSEESVNALAKKAADAFGKVDILMSNAMNMGAGGGFSLLNASSEIVKQQCDVSIIGTLHCIKAFVPAMVKRKHGVIGYIASGFRMARGGGTYFAVKGATSAMMLGLAAELGDVNENGVAVFILVPGNVVTPRPEDAQRPRQNVFAGLNVGYDGPMPPEDAGAAIAYTISHAAEIHGSGVTIGQVQKHMGWPFPNPEMVPLGDFDRLRDGVGVRIFGYMGEGFSQPGYKKYSLSRTDSVTGELTSFVQLMKELEKNG
jgi:NAD(P)-dependent dehydrogenase (short-subunit alcohol dehydrogenase family)